MAKGLGSGKGAGLACLALLVAVIIALLGLIGLCLNIWQIVDALKTNGDLMSLARVAVNDDRLLNAIYTSLAFLSLSIFFSCVARNNDDDNSDSTCSLVRAAFNLLLLAGYLACAILAALYLNQTLPNMQRGMEQTLNRTFLKTSGGLSVPEYSAIGKHFNFLQTKYECCGVAKADGGDYLDSGFKARYNLTVPYSCCVLKDHKLDKRNVNLEDVVDYDKCSTYDPQYFHTETCYQYEFKFLQFKCHFLMGYNFTMVSLVVLLFIVLLLVLCCTG